MAAPRAARAPRRARAGAAPRRTGSETPPAARSLLLLGDPHGLDRAIRRLHDLDRHAADLDGLAGRGNPPQLLDQKARDGLVVLALGQPELELRVDPRDARPRLDPPRPRLLRA